MSLTSSEEPRPVPISYFLPLPVTDLIQQAAENPDQSEVLRAGQNLYHQPPFDRAIAGVATSQNLPLFDRGTLLAKTTKDHEVVLRKATGLLGQLVWKKLQDQQEDHEMDPVALFMHPKMHRAAVGQVQSYFTGIDYTSGKERDRLLTQLGFQVNNTARKNILELLISLLVSLEDYPVWSLYLQDPHTTYQYLRDGTFKIQVEGKDLPVPTYTSWLSKLATNALSDRFIVPEDMLPDPQKIAAQPTATSPTGRFYQLLRSSGLLPD